LRDYQIGCFYEKLLTDRQRQTRNRRTPLKHILLGRGNDLKYHIFHFLEVKNLNLMRGENTKHRQYLVKASACAISDVDSGGFSKFKEFKHWKMICYVYSYTHIYGH